MLHKQRDSPCRESNVSAARGRPREFDTERALEQAMHLFWRQGYRGTTTRDLESALGVTQSSLYQAFGSKADLMETVLDRYQQLIDESLIQPLMRGDDGLAALDRFFSDLADWLAEDDGRGCLIGRLMSEPDRPDPRLQAPVDRYRSRLRAAVGGALSRAAEDGDVPTDTVESRTGVLVGMVLGLNQAVQAGYDPAAQRRLADAIRSEIGRWRG
jgi:TetR/AcrR family transcriptional repressor of nem operon